MDSAFIAYVGDPDIHDGTIVFVEQSDGVVQVQVRGASGRMYIAEFRNVRAIQSHEPIGMLLYSLSELSSDAPVRRFAFANWYTAEENPVEAKRMLEIEAEEFTFSPVA